MRAETTSAEAPLFTPLGELPSVEPVDEALSAEGGWRLELDLGDGLRLTLRKVA
jgi:hypothetical protein